MSAPSPPDLVKVTEIFLIPNSFLVAAIGTADTNLHRAAISVLGLTISILWWVCVRDVEAELRRSPTAVEMPWPLRMKLLSWLANVFVIGWLASLVIHLVLYNRPLGS